jgi:hypothetical protein
MVKKPTKPFPRSAKKKKPTSSRKRKIITHLTRLFFVRLHCSAELFSSSYHSTPSSNSE